MKIPRKNRILSRQRGFSLIELMISMVVLLIGLGGLLVFLVTAMYTNKTAGADTSSTMIAEHVLEQITAQGLQATTPLTITDCTYPTPVTTNFATNPAVLGSGNSGAYGGNGARLTETDKLTGRKLLQCSNRPGKRLSLCNPVHGLWLRWETDGL